MANQKLPLHICNTIKQYILLLNNNNKFKFNLYFNLKQKLNLEHNLKFEQKLKFVILLVLILSQNTLANDFGRNSMLRTRVIGTRYGKLQGVILPMDQHKYLKPIEAYLGVPYATPPTGSNR